MYYRLENFIVRNICFCFWDTMFFAAAFNPVFEESALGLLSVHVSPLREDEDVFGLPNRCCLFLKICELMSVP